MALSNKQIVFVNEYLKCWNATKAARRAGYAHANKQGPRLLVNVGICAEIQRRLSEHAMSANEVLVRLAEQARATITDFLRVLPNGDVELDLDLAKGKTHLIKKIRKRHWARTTQDGAICTTVWSLELYDAQAALVHIGRHHQLFTNQMQHSGTFGPAASLFVVYGPEDIVASIEFPRKHGESRE